MQKFYRPSDTFHILLCRSHQIFLVILWSISPGRLSGSQQRDEVGSNAVTGYNVTKLPKASVNPVQYSVFSLYASWLGEIFIILFSMKIFSSVQLLSRVWLFATPWTAACQASLSITNSWSLLKLISIKLVMPSNHLILRRPLLLLPSIFPSIRVWQWRFIFNVRNFLRTVRNQLIFSWT